MRIQIWTVAALFVLFLLSSCQAAVPAVTEPATQIPQAQPTAVENPTEIPVGYPGPNEETENLIATPTFPPDTTVLYPDPKDGDQVPWHQAVAMMENGDVTAILLGENTKMTFMLVDGRALISFEPRKNALQEVLENCGDVCASIEMK